MLVFSYGAGLGGAMLTKMLLDEVAELPAGKLINIKVIIKNRDLKFIYGL